MRRNKMAALVGGAVLGVSLLAGCSGSNVLQQVPDPKAEPTGDDVVLSLLLAGEPKLLETEGSVDKVAQAGERVVYTFTVESRAKTKLEKVGVVTDIGQFWCKSEDGETEGLQIDLEPGKKLICSNDGLGEDAKKAEAVDVKRLGEDDLKGASFDVYAKAYGFQPKAGDVPAKQSQSTPILLKVPTGKK